MAKTTVKLEEVRKLLENANVRVNQQVSAATGQLVVELMKDRIAKGISPIEGKPRFPGYKDTKKYPGGVKRKFPDKRNRPVNLRLSGKFLSDLRVISASAAGRIVIGFTSKYGKTLEQGHREGANGQRERPIIPEESEELAKSIRLAILKLYEQAVRKFLKSRK